MRKLDMGIMELVNRNRKAEVYSRQVRELRRERERVREFNTLVRSAFVGACVSIAICLVFSIKAKAENRYPDYSLESGTVLHTEGNTAHILLDRDGDIYEVSANNLTPGDGVECIVNSKGTKTPLDDEITGVSKINTRYDYKIIYGYCLDNEGNGVEVIPGTMLPVDTIYHYVSYKSTTAKAGDYIQTTELLNPHGECEERYDVIFPR